MVAGTTSTVFVNEIHYDNKGQDTGEFIEIANTTGTDLTGWSLVLYNGADARNATTYDKIALSGSASFTTVKFPTDGIQNGPRDGLALVDASGKVVQLLSYQGTFTAGNGPAAGLTSTDIGVKENGAPAGHSLQLSGKGATYGDFTWSDSATATAGSANTGQGLAPIKEIKAFGSTGDDKIIGDAGAKHFIVARKGDDIVTGATMDDFLLGNGGKDTLYGLEGNDILFGGKHNDQLFGGSGNDRLSGDKGSDQLTGGADADIFAFKGKFGHDTILDFAIAEDKIEFKGKVFSNFDEVLSAANQVGSDVEILARNGSSITVENVLLGDLTSDHFLFV